MKNEKIRLAIEKKLNGLVEANRGLHNAYLLIHSDKYNIHWNMAAGQTGNMSAHAGQPYHTASIGKAFTSVIIAMLAEQGKLNYQDPIDRYLSADIIQDLHVYRGKDYSHQIQIKHLVNHTSGLPDFYEDKPRQGKHFLELILDDPARFWTPAETIQWTKEHYKTRFAVGQGFHYSNTGYNLLGLIIEQVTSKPYQEVLHEYIFNPLGMRDSYLSQFSEPAIKSNYPVAHINANGREINIEDYRSFSSIYSGGQTVSTSEDLLLFMQALLENKLIQNKTLSSLQQWNKRWTGLDHGYGLMRVRMLPFITKYNAWGHLGSIGSFMLYNPVMDVHIIGNFNKTAYLGPAMRFVLGALRKISAIGH